MRSIRMSWVLKSDKNRIQVFPAAPPKSFRKENLPRVTCVVLAEDHPKVRACIKKLLGKAPDIEIIAEAVNGEEALRLTEQYAPDVLLLDLEMPFMNGIEVTRRLHARNSPVQIVVLSAHQDQAYIRGMLASGAAEYLTKEEVPARIVNTVRSVAS